ncbi:MAG: N-acetyltransferase [Gammaproteobacteria bacterium]
MAGAWPGSSSPGWQNRKIGSRLIQEGLEMCLRIGAHAVFVLGSSTFYPRFGFRPAMDFGLRCEYAVPAQAFMTLELRKDALANVKGQVKYHPAFTLLNDTQFRSSL